MLDLGDLKALNSFYNFIPCIQKVKLEQKRYIKDTNQTFTDKSYNGWS